VGVFFGSKTSKRRSDDLTDHIGDAEKNDNAFDSVACGVLVLEKAVDEVANGFHAVLCKEILY
jgi:hypothetical protein